MKIFTFFSNICWKDLGDVVINYYNSLPAEEKESCLINAEIYGQAGAISFYGKNITCPNL